MATRVQVCTALRLLTSHNREAIRFSKTKFTQLNPDFFKKIAESRGKSFNLWSVRTCELLPAMISSRS